MLTIGAWLCGECSLLLQSFIAVKLALLEVQGASRSGAAARTLKTSHHENFVLVTDVGEGGAMLTSRRPSVSAITLGPVRTSRRHSNAGMMALPSGDRPSTSASTSSNNNSGSGGDSTVPENALAFKPSTRLLQVCPELASWHVPDVLIKKQQQQAAAAKRKFAKWAAVRGKILEVARTAIRNHPKPKPKV